jgi:type VI secretion system protein ImpC
MPRKSSFADVKLDVNPGASPSAEVMDPDTPFRILLMGDFSGRALKAPTPATRWKPVSIDRDNFEQVLGRMGVALPKLSMYFAEMDDFHPDRIYENSEIFRTLRERRKAGKPPAPPPETRAAALDVRAARSGSLLDSILEESPPQPARPVSRRDDLQSFVERVTAPHLVPAEDPQAVHFQEQVDAESGERMRAILHYPDFQALEAAWRALFWLVGEIESDTQIKLYVLDVSKGELESDLEADDLRETQTWRVLVKEAAATPDGEPWAVVAGNYAFANTGSDVQMLGRLAKIMRAAGAPFLGEADPKSKEPVGESTGLWEGLRRSPEAAWIGLAMPRFLLRAPYGKQSAPLETFDFEEMPGAPEHQSYLWGNPAFACVQLLAEGFAGDGWAMRPGKHSTIEGLPIHIYDDDGEPQAKPCAEVLLTEREIDWILEEGWIPLASVKSQGAVRVVRFQSIATPPAALNGRWA